MNVQEYINLDLEFKKRLSESFIENDSRIFSTESKEIEGYKYSFDRSGLNHSELELPSKQSLAISILLALLIVILLLC